MKEKYESPVMEVVAIDKEDIIMASGECVPGVASEAA